MAVTNYSIKYPVLDNTASISLAVVPILDITSSNNTNDIVIKNAFKNRNNTLFLIFVVDGISTSVTIKAGNKYPNAKLGDLTIPITQTSAVQIQDPSRFETSDGNIILHFSSSFVGKVFAVGKDTSLISAIPLPLHIG